jgi:Spy/CpxP family protein refolding chaperone
MVIHLLAASLLLFQGAGGRRPSGSDGPPIAAAHEPTPFEVFAQKLNLDDETQLPQVAKILSAGAAQGSPIGRELIQARLRLIDLDGKPEAAAQVDAITASALKLTALDAKTFQQIYAMLEKGQQSKAPEAFVLEAGLLDMATPRAGGGGGAGRGRGLADIRPGRLELLTTLFTLNDAQKKQVKSIMDAEYKASSAARDQWTASRMAIGKAIQSGSAPADLDQAVAKHAADAAQMAAAEARALAKIFALLTPEQKANTTAIQLAVFHTRLAFAGKKWDVSPE